MRPEEYLQELRKELNNPEEYIVEGVYYFHGKENEFTGLFEIDQDGKVVGKIEDPNSICPMHVVRGEIQQLDDYILLEFVKIPTGLLAPIYYSLKRPNDGSLEGKYQGIWDFHEEVLRADMSNDEHTKAIINYISSKKFPDSSHETEVTNKTEISLYKNSVPTDA